MIRRPEDRASVPEKVPELKPEQQVRAAQAVKRYQTFLAATATSTDVEAADSTDAADVSASATVSR